MADLLVPQENSQKQRGKARSRQPRRRRRKVDTRSSNRRSPPVSYVTELHWDSTCGSFCIEPAGKGWWSLSASSSTVWKTCLQRLLLLIGYTCIRGQDAAAAATATTLTATAATPAGLRSSVVIPRESWLELPDLTANTVSVMHRFTSRRNLRAAATAKDAPEYADLLQERRHAIQRALNAALLDLSYHTLYDQAATEGHARGFFKWWDDPYIIILLGFTAAVIFAMGIWCLFASYK